MEFPFAIFTFQCNIASHYTVPIYRLCATSFLVSKPPRNAVHFHSVHCTLVLPSPCWHVGCCTDITPSEPRSCWVWSAQCCLHCPVCHHCQHSSVTGERRGSTQPRPACLLSKLCCHHPHPHPQVWLSSLLFMLGFSGEGASAIIGLAAMETVDRSRSGSAHALHSLAGQGEYNSHVTTMIVLVVM